ncbi:hypothetical protein [Demequina sp. NBRC 110051]|uniref:hypothetical protein n=1 Tax=Demequina sp. NBRC 110051 TaxID=1570340 RepID=UPI00117E81BE|nr:hypothetical protein [Demequina sp. NBRC 110051]
MSHVDGARAAHFTPTPDEHVAGTGAPDWMSRLPPPPLGPRTDPTPIVRRASWLRALASGLGFGVMGAVLYASLYILVGQEIQAAAPVVGILVGSGLRLAGRPTGWATGTVAVAMGVAFLLVGVAVGQSCLDSIALPAPLGATMADAFADPVQTVAHYLSTPLSSVLAIALAAAGALLATLAFRPRRGDEGAS